MAVEIRDGQAGAARGAARVAGAMHWSWPEGRDFLVWLARSRGGQNTAWSYAETTRRLHPNNGACSARRVLEALGIPGAMTLDGPDAAVEQFGAGRTERERDSSVYRLRPNVRLLLRFLLATGHEDWLETKAAGLGHRAQILERYNLARGIESELKGGGGGSID